LPCGITLKNRLVKAAMTERMSNTGLAPTNNHVNLYNKWSDTGAGLLITGNVMVDDQHLESAGNVVFHGEHVLPTLRRWAQAATGNNTHCWVQISHAGRQTNIFNNVHPLAPSPVKLKKLGLFGTPKEMTETDIENTIERFVKTAVLSRKAGFTGIQIHAAHGYLLSQFLSPRTNNRLDQWGGSLENRSRILKYIVSKTRKSVGSDYPISVKLNSADFQRGGFTEDDSLEVIKMLENEGIDLLEISGGTYENVVFFVDEQQKESTRSREAYFIDFAKKIRRISKLPLMVTGGFRSYDFCNEVLENDELDFVGMARPFLTNHTEIKRFLLGEIERLEEQHIRTGIRTLEDAAEAGYYARQLIRMAKGLPYRKKLNPFWCSNYLVLHEFRKAIKKKVLGSTG
jgi:2,4-dienoyl-CoA reductase-like NADH-dependent reductase (Old Yellow Enzyme family)